MAVDQPVTDQLPAHQIFTEPVQGNAALRVGLVKIWISRTTGSVETRYRERHWRKMEDGLS